MKAKTFDEKFDQGEEDIVEYLDLSQARRGELTQERVNVDFPEWMIKGLDLEARRLGITRQSLIKVWIAERLERAL
ncbi:CopG family antitoxin [Roseofilum reptotaenium CS-1145]|uniref:CopG family transcriptional regulator n=1 Tax=Roseofilum reptotaenium AO1-A TaxID=1925591 RepID=A0A1L9QPM8_9CYAN|nr:CopG family antitoxin [Roseofilum reptotaenium]MDB9515767.1 CopG family antitoxin [Roseofilum reptotaenium CS-1145]OJJ24630.1 CopG family transcriptional regulator [Roseofilum reptotaenium AO1-A]